VLYLSIFCEPDLQYLFSVGSTEEIKEGISWLQWSNGSHQHLNIPYSSYLNIDIQRANKSTNMSVTFWARYSFA
jgi:hypothetical protein